MYLLEGGSEHQGLERLAGHVLIPPDGVVPPPETTCEERGGEGKQEARVHDVDARRSQLIPHKQEMKFSARSRKVMNH